MKWNKEAVIIVAIIFTISYIYNLKSEGEMSDKIWAQTYKKCEKEKRDDCKTWKKYHDLCFSVSYRSQLKAMHFFENEYTSCMKKQLSP